MTQIICEKRYHSCFDTSSSSGEEDIETDNSVTDSALQLTEIVVRYRTRATKDRSHIEAAPVLYPHKMPF